MNKINYSKVIAIGIIVFTALAIIGLSTFRSMQKRDTHIDVPRDRYPVRGIDVSAHNGDIDFRSVASDSVDFVYIKATEGISYKDPKFDQNCDSAIAAGLNVGVYHFFRFECDGWRQSENVLRAIDNKRIKLPIAIDVEEWGNPVEETTETIIRRLNDMIDHLAINGHHVIIYTNKRGYSRFIRNNFKDIETWICSFTIPPLAHENWTLWQHSHRAKVKGIEGNVDLNTFNGSRSDWQHWLKQPYDYTIISKDARYNKESL
jgi:lysozyme